MDIDEIEAAGEINLSEIVETFLQSFCKKTATSFFEEYGLISHQLNSYNFFIQHGLQKVFDSFGEMLVEPSFDATKNKDHDWRYATVKFGEVSVEKPTFFADDKELGFLPWHARLQNMTYSARMKVNVQVEVFKKEVVKSDIFKTGQDEYVEKKILDVIKQDILIGRIPVMVRSVLCKRGEKGKESCKIGDCAFDQGGYFVIKGAEKVFIAQEQICTKRLWISNSPWTVSFRSKTKRNRFIVRLAENQKSEDYKRKEKILTVYFLSTEIPVWLLFFALGVSSDKEVIDLIAFDGDDASITNSLIASIHEADTVCDAFRFGNNALAYVEQIRKSTKFPPAESVNDCLRLYLFPGLQGLKHKARFLGYMVKCLLNAYSGKRKCENRDRFRNKRIELAGELLEREIRVHLAHARKTMTKTMQKHLIGDGHLKPIEHYLDASIITNGLNRAFSTGAWSHPFRKMERVSGVVANLGRANPLQTLIDLRRTRQQVLYTGKVGDARYPHPSHWGRVCFLSTPDGENCGLVKNMSLLGLVSTQILEPVVENLFGCGMEELVDDTSTPLFDKHKVFLNGDWVGLCSDSESFVTELKSRRRQSELPRQMEIKRDEDDNEVRIFTDAGRLLQPLLVVENLHKLKQEKPTQYPFEHLLGHGILELVGIEEEEDCNTAWGIKQLLKEPKNYTHCELDLSFLLGVSCAIVPFANHDHGKRVLYQSQKHCQQAIGFSSTNPNIRCDTLSQQLFYPQKPLFKTLASECLQKEVLFNGQNAIVAVNVHLGYNQEDPIVMNKASSERGMFLSEQIRSYKAEVDSKDSEKRKKMDELVQFGKTHSKIGIVDSLDDDGFPFIGANMNSGDIVIGRCTESGADHGVKLKHTEKGIVQKVVLSSNDEGKNFAVVSLRQVRSPCLGDKFSSMHGQKGVSGYLEEQDNFPFTIQGIVPDIAISPHAFPSRQTPGQLLEAALSKGIASPIQKKDGSSAIYAKLTRHATPFSTPSVTEITEQLHSCLMDSSEGFRSLRGGGITKATQEEDKRYTKHCSKLETLGLRVHKVDGDGNCLFRAISEQLYECNDENKHKSVRDKIVAHMQSHPDIFKDFTVGAFRGEFDNDYNKYCEFMMRNGTYGGAPELKAAAHLFNCKIIVHQVSLDNPLEFAPDDFDGTESKIIFLSYNRKSKHYDSLHRVEEGVTQAMEDTTEDTTEGTTEGNKKRVVLHNSSFRIEKKDVNDVIPSFKGLKIEIKDFSVYSFQEKEVASRAVETLENAGYKVEYIPDREPISKTPKLRLSSNNVTVLWDWQSCRYPLRIHPKILESNMKARFKLEKHTFKPMHMYCMPAKEEEEAFELLQSKQWLNVYKSCKVKSGGKIEPPEYKIELKLLSWMVQYDPPAPIVLVTSRDCFVDTIETMKTHGYHIHVAFGPRSSKKLKKVSKCSCESLYLSHPETSFSY